MVDLADNAYAHACAVLRPGDEATETAIYAVRRGGRSRSAVLGHARHEALVRASDAEAPDLDHVAPEDLTELAIALSRTRPPLERSVVDLSTRHGLDRGGLARAMGLPPAAAGSRSAAVSLDWQFVLDPVVLARLGAGDCDDLAEILAVSRGAHFEVQVDSPAPGPAPASGSPATLGELLALGPAVAAHAAACSVCGDRLRSMVSVRTLLGQRPLETAPDGVRAALSPSRLRLSVPAPPLDAAGPEQPRRLVRPVMVAAVAVLAVGGVAAMVMTRREAPTSIEALTEVPAAGSALRASPASVEGPVPPPVFLENGSGRDVEWEAAPDVEWLAVEPRRGVLKSGGRARLEVSILPLAPEGDIRGSVRIQGAEGSATVVRLVTTVERPPDVAARLEGCVVSVAVEDEGQVGAVELHRREAVREDVTPMEPTASGFAGQLGNTALPVTWWVTAVDARGNATRTPDQVLPPNSCP